MEFQEKEEQQNQENITGEREAQEAASWESESAQQSQQDNTVSPETVLDVTPAQEPAPEGNAVQPEQSQWNPQSPVTNYYQYKENIKSMKAEMRALKKEAKKRQKQARASQPGAKRTGVGGFRLAALMIVCIAVGCALSLVLIAFVPNTESSLLAQMAKRYGSQQTTIVKDGGTDGTITIQDETTSVAKAVYQKAAQSVVGIRIVSITNQFFNRTETILSEGSGIIYSEDGLIVTNYHVISDATVEAASTSYEIRVYLDSDLSQYYTAEMVGTDSDTDLALLKINVDGLTPIEFADYGTVEIGDATIAIGSPGGLDYMNSVSEGIVSGLNRDITTSTGISFELIQTTAAINPGNSGGALLNSKGQLIGICVIKIAATEYEGMGFAINSDTIRSVITSIQENGSVERPVLGITVRTDYTSDVAQAYNYPAGAYVYSVTEGSSADIAGIREDDIIYQFGDITLTGYADLRKALNRYNIGDTVVLKLYRLETGEDLEVTVTLGR